LFANIAINYGDIIAIGGVKDDLHYDKTKRFARQTTRLFNSVLGKEKSKRKVKIVVPYRNYSKKELVHLYIEQGGDIEKLKNESWSCHFPEDGKPCSKCIPCIKKENIIREVQQGYDKQYPIYYPY
jgi:7-cyano-7-deazaguanine synthase in queuosine biosynthesis